jgi:hypothetical protein
MPKLSRGSSGIIVRLCGGYPAFTSKDNVSKLSRVTDKYIRRTFLLRWRYFGDGKYFLLQILHSKVIKINLKRSYAFRMTKSYGCHDVEETSNKCSLGNSRKLRNTSKKKQAPF